MSGLTTAIKDTSSVYAVQHLGQTSCNVMYLTLFISIVFKAQHVLLATMNTNRSILASTVDSYLLLTR